MKYEISTNNKSYPFPKISPPTIQSPTTLEMQGLENRIEYPPYMDNAD